MSALITAELAKLRSVRTTWGLLVASLALAALSVAATIVSASTVGVDLGSADGIAALFGGGAGSASTLALVLGLLMAAGEFRHGTIPTTLLAVPDRRRVVAAKVAAGALAGAAFAAAAALLTLAVAVPWLAAEGVEVRYASGDVWWSLLGGVVVSALYAPVGVGVGTLLPNQVAAICASLGWVFVLEPLLLQFLPEVGRWVPGGAASALLRAPLPELLPAWGGGLLFAAYAAALAVAGAAALARRDVS